MSSSTAVIEVSEPERLVRRLLAHLGRKSTIVSDGASHTIHLSMGGTAVVEVSENRIDLRADGADENELGVVEEVVGVHLERFGQRLAVHVNWVRV